MAADVQLYLPDFVYKGAPEVVLRWTFTTWAGPRPTGTLRVTLPAR